MQSLGTNLKGYSSSDMIYGKNTKTENSIELYIRGRAFIGESILFWYSLHTIIPTL
jgi:hypothetical protein